MRTPVRAVPVAVERWASRARWLRPLDALATSAAVWFISVALDVDAWTSAGAASGLVAGGALLRPLRNRWRPVSGPLLLSVSRPLRPGDRAWHVRGDRVDPVIVTASRRLRLVVAGPDQEPAEGLEVRRTRTMVVPSAL